MNEYTSIDPDTSADPPYPVSLVSDPNGNLTNDPTAPNVSAYADGQEYEYDSENRLTRVMRSVDSQPLLDIRYDAFGRRAESVEHIDPTDGSARTTPLVTRHIYAGPTVVEEYDVTDYGPGPGNDRRREFVWGDRFPEPVAMIDWSGAGDKAAGQSEVLHYLRDELGSVVGLTNESGALVERYTYDPYGPTYIEDTGVGQFRPSSRFGNPFMWTGQRYDAIAGLYHFFFRSYSPRWGRWLQRDPAGYISGGSLYGYVASRPTRWYDAWGMYSVGFGGGVEAGSNNPFLPGLPGLGGSIDFDVHIAVDDDGDISLGATLTGGVGPAAGLGGFAGAHVIVTGAESVSDLFGPGMRAAVNVGLGPSWGAAILAGGGPFGDPDIDPFAGVAVDIPGLNAGGLITITGPAITWTGGVDVGVDDIVETITDIISAIERIKIRIIDAVLTGGDAVQEVLEPSYPIPDPC